MTQDKRISWGVKELPGFPFYAWPKGTPKPESLETAVRVAPDHMAPGMQVLFKGNISDSGWNVGHLVQHQDGFCIEDSCALAPVSIVDGEAWTVAVITKRAIISLTGRQSPNG